MTLVPEAASKLVTCQYQSIAQAFLATPCCIQLATAFNVCSSGTLWLSCSGPNTCKEQLASYGKNAHLLELLVNSLGFLQLSSHHCLVIVLRLPLLQVCQNFIHQLFSDSAVDVGDVVGLLQHAMHGLLGGCILWACNKPHRCLPYIHKQYFLHQKCLLQLPGPRARSCPYPLRSSCATSWSTAADSWSSVFPSLLSLVWAHQAHHRDGAHVQCVSLFHCSHLCPRMSMSHPKRGSHQWQTWSTPALCKTTCSSSVVDSTQCGHSKRWLTVHFDIIRI